MKYNQVIKDKDKSSFISFLQVTFEAEQNFIKKIFSLKKFTYALILKVIVS